MSPPARPWRLIVGLVATELGVAVGLLAYLTSEDHARHDPVHSLQQADFFYLDEPAPFAGELRLPPGRAALVVVCSGCRPPSTRFATRVTAERRIGTAYGLFTADGRPGPGYAVVDRQDRVRYRTFDPGLAHHGEEIRILLEAAS